MEGNDEILDFCERMSDRANDFQTAADMTGFGDVIAAIRHDMALVVEEVRRTHSKNDTPIDVVNAGIACGCADELVRITSHT